ncbi:MAG: hypothetical protein PHS14_04950 [Elusimicrobia bacterium]|nr:hypothetical protein [Elusimicrobiota bacterium]
MILAFSYAGSPHDVALLIRSRGLVDATAAADRVTRRLVRLLLELASSRKRRTRSVARSRASGTVEAPARVERARKTGRRRRRSSPRRAETPLPVPTNRVPDPLPPCPEPTAARPVIDPKKARFDEWMHETEEKRAAAGRESVASLGGDVEDVPLATAIERRS